jgi:hypothetical protein
MKRQMAFVVIACSFVATTALPALATAPSNDLIRNAATISSVPFSVELDATESHTDGPDVCRGNKGSVFYKFRPSSDMQLQADTLGSRYDTVLAVLRGPIGDLRVVACNDDRLGADSAVRFDARAGVRYIFMISRCCGHRAGHGGQLDLWLGEAPTDAFAIDVDATAGVVDPASGEIEFEGTLDCTHRSTGDVYGTVRQRRGEFFVARGYFSFSFTCTGSTQWSASVQLEGDIAFAEGDARFRFFLESWDGFDYLFLDEPILETVTLT